MYEPMRIQSHEFFRAQDFQEKSAKLYIIYIIVQSYPFMGILKCTTERGLAQFVM